MVSTWYLLCEADPDVVEATKRRAEAKNEDFIMFQEGEVGYQRANGFEEMLKVNQMFGCGGKYEG